jgi:superfamily I DNA/RNA helicase/RecB family exonuclease
VELTLTDGQREVVEHDGALLRVHGGPGTGKTTALHHRWLRLAARHGADRVLTVCPTAVAARRFRDALVPHIRGAWSALAITTPWGLANDIVQRHGSAARLISRAERWTIVHDILPTHRQSPGWVDEVLGTLDELRAAAIDDHEVRVRARAHGTGERWEELLATAARYADVLATRNLVDAVGVLTEATALCAAHPAGERFTALLVDDHHRAAAAPERLVAALGVPDTVLTFLDVAPPPGGGVVLDHGFRAARSELVECPHPALEADAIACVLRDAAARGVPWSEMAVLVRRPATRGRTIIRALARHGVPVAAPRSRVRDEPAARGVVDTLRWLAGDDAALPRVATSPVGGFDATELRTLVRDARRDDMPLANHPAMAGLRALRNELSDAVARGASAHDLAWMVWRGRLSSLATAPGGALDPVRDRALDAVVALLDDINTWATTNPGAPLTRFLAAFDATDEASEPDPWRADPAPVDDAVTISSIDAAAGCEWRTVVVAGCTEGELPHLRGHVHWYDRALLVSAAVPTVAQRRLASLDDEQRLFALATSRATDEVVATASRAPGVLLSRFVAEWPRRVAPPPFADVAPARPPPPTPGTAPVWPDARLTLSASQLNTWDDCHLKYLFSHVLRARGASSVWADFGSLVHDILATYLDPENHNERSWERLLEVAEDRWRDDVAPYRPQREQVRRELYDVLEKWWALEGEGPLAPDVLAVERPIHAEVTPHAVRGYVDRIDRLPGGGLAVVDYKTGKKPISEEDAADDIQLALYHLCVSADPELAAHGPVRSLRLLYLRHPTAVEQPVLPDHAATTKARVQALAGEILTETFAPSVDADCRLCDYHRLCPLQPAGREVGMRDD